MVFKCAFLVKERPFEYLNKIAKIQPPKKAKTRTKVDFLFERANIFFKKPARKLGSKIKKKSTFPARDKIKIPLLQAYNSIFHYDLMVLSETYLNKTVKNEDIIIDGFSTEIFRSDHPSGDKQGGVCVYFKGNLPVKRRKDLEILQETVICEISLGRKKVLFVALYRSPN